MAFTTRQGDGLDVQPVAILLLVRAVALVAVLLEDGPHLADIVDREGGGSEKDDEGCATHGTLHTLRAARLLTPAP